MDAICNEVGARSDQVSADWVFNDGKRATEKEVEDKLQQQITYASFRFTPDRGFVERFKSL